MSQDKFEEESHSIRSRFIRNLIQYPSVNNPDSLYYYRKPPKKIVQFWDEVDCIPSDVRECIESWAKVESQGIERLLFGKHDAEEFIERNLGKRYLTAFNKCYHPAMQSDYFRLCYIYVEGGCYVDTDDVYNGTQIIHLFQDGSLKIQPLCYDIATNMMVSPNIFTEPGADKATWIFYFNNNPLIACSGHPVIKYVLNQATLQLENAVSDVLPEIQATTGPGNLSKSLFDIISINESMQNSIHILNDWESIAYSKWQLSYRNDSRNWRHSNCQRFQR